MSRYIGSTVLALLAVVSCGQENQGQPAQPQRTAAEKKLLDNPNDSLAISTYVSEVLSAVSRLMQTDPKAAEAKLDAADEFIAGLKTDNAAAKSRLTNLKTTFQYYRDRIDVENVSLGELERALLETPGDSKAVKRFVTKLQIEVGLLTRSQPDQAEKKLEAAKAAVAKAREKAESESARRQLSSLTSQPLASLERAISTARMTFAELAQEFANNPDNLQARLDFSNRLLLEVNSQLRSKPDEAAAKIELAKEVLTKVEAATSNASTKSAVTRMRSTLDSMAQSLEAARKLTEMIGKDAAPLKVEAWVNGSPLTDKDLKGKVVFLDFWAVWCGPCIATFPHLREWNEKYGDKGLVMIGLTNYYNFEWNAEEKRAARSTDKVSPTDEQKMLERFAESHELKHRFAIEADRSLSEYYGVTGIPHVVVIDQEGKVRLMKVGSGEANAKEIGELLEKLLAPKAAG